MRIQVAKSELEPALGEAVELLAEHYPLNENGAGSRAVRFKRVEGSAHAARFEADGEAVVIEYSSVAGALRGLGSVLGAEDAKALRPEGCVFETLGIMLDCSRNAVMKVEHLQQWLRQLALLGYTTVMLYTEDTYELPDEPYFGYMRGPYTASELKAVDDYAARLGIEMIPCIQTLGHMEQVMRWPVYKPVREADRILLPGVEESYALIEKMLDFWSQTYRTRRIHIGMDEAWGLGRGQYLDKFGYRDPFDIFNEHLDRVTRMCKEKGLEPMIWSDMYFRLGNQRGDYYSPETVIPDHVKQAIPRDVQLIYWDYYHQDEGFYKEWIERHRALDHEPIVASGAWTWGRPWHSTSLTELNGGPAVRGSRDAGVKEFFVTLWGDDGAMCDFDSAFTGLAFLADLSYGGNATPSTIAPRFAAVCHGDYEAARLAGRISTVEHGQDGQFARIFNNWAWMWDDPLLGAHWRKERDDDPSFWDAALERFNQIRQGLANVEEQDCGAGNLAQARRLAEWFAMKVELRRELEDAYAQRDMAALGRLPAKIEQIIELCEVYAQTLRQQWMKRNKPFGLETPQIRLAGHQERWRELIRRIEALRAGHIDSIPELDLETPQPKAQNFNWCHLVTKSSYTPI